MFLVNKLKIITKQAYEKYLIIIHKVENKDNEKKYIVNDIINFIKIFIKEHEVNLDCGSLLQYFNEEKRIFII